MGCGGSKSSSTGLGNQSNVEIPAIDIAGLEKYSKFEHSFPFYRTRIEVFEGRVKRFVSGKSSVSLPQLKYAFKDDSKWKDLQNDDSLLVTILKSDFFEDEKNKGEINVQSLLLWGMILCAGDNNMKSRVFYDILQDSLQETISAADKDFKESFFKLLDLSTKLPYRFEKDLEGSDGKGSPNEDKISEDTYDTIAEEFLDSVYGSLSKRPRKEYMDLVAQQ
jgi:hypothetical protein